MQTYTNISESKFGNICVKSAVENVWLSKFWASVCISVVRLIVWAVNSFDRTNTIRIQNRFWNLCKWLLFILRTVSASWLLIDAFLFQHFSLFQITLWFPTVAFTVHTGRFSLLSDGCLLFQPYNIWSFEHSSIQAVAVIVDLYFHCVGLCQSIIYAQHMRKQLQNIIASHKNTKIRICCCCQKSSPHKHEICILIGHLPNAMASNVLTWKSTHKILNQFWMVPLIRYKILKWCNKSCFLPCLRRFIVIVKICPWEYVHNVNIW